MMLSVSFCLFVANWGLPATCSAEQQCFFHFPSEAAREVRIDAGLSSQAGDETDGNEGMKQPGHPQAI